MARFRVFSSEPFPPLALPNVRLCRHPRIIYATLPPSHITPDHQFTQHNRNRALVLGFVFFSPPAHLLTSNLRTHSPTTTTSLSAPHHYLPTLSCTPISHGVPEIEPSCSVSWFFALQPIFPPRTCERTTPPPPPAYPHHTTTSSHCPAPPFRTAYLKTSCHTRFRGFRP